MPDVVMVTGASAGAGRSMAKRFAAAGFDIVAVARREELLAVLVTEIESEYGVRVTPVCADLTLPRAAERVYDEVRPLGVSVLVNNAGIGDWNYAWDVGVERLHEMIDLNVRALSVLSVLFVRDNKDRDAQLINVASGAGYALFVGAAPYSATKFFVTALTEGIHHDLRATGATCAPSCSFPGRSTPNSRRCRWRRRSCRSDGSPTWSSTRPTTSPISPSSSSRVTARWGWSTPPTCRFTSAIMCTRQRN